MRLNEIIPFAPVQCLTCVLCALGALLLGIFLPLGNAYDALRYGSAIFMGLLLAAWFGILALSYRENNIGKDPSQTKANYLWVLLLAIATVVFLRIDPAFAVMDDEGIVLNTGLALYEEGELFAASKGYWVDDDFILVDGRLDKRPFLYAYIMSLVHHLAGYGVENAFLLNFFFGLCVCWVGWSLFCRFFSPLVSFLAILPLLSCSVFLQCVRGAGFETFNFLMLALLGWSMLRYYDFPNLKNQGLLILTAVLLSYSRYESVGVIPVVGVLIVFIIRPDSRSIRVLCIAPWLLVPYLWLFRCTLARTDSFQEASTGELSAFSFSYMGQNILDAAKFLFSPDWTVPNDLFVTIIGLSGGVIFLSTLAKRLRKVEGMFCLREDSMDQADRLMVASAWLLIFPVLLGIIFGYFWSSFLDVLAQRFSLLTIWPLLFGVGCLLQWAVNSKSKFTPVIFAPVWLILSVPNLASIDASRSRSSLAEYQTWKMNWLASASLNPETTIFIDPHQDVWTSMRYSAITPSNLNLRMPQLELGKRIGRFEAVYLIELVELDKKELPNSHRWNSHYFTLDSQIVASCHASDGQSLARIRRVLEIHLPEEDKIPLKEGEQPSILSYLP